MAMFHPKHPDGNYEIHNLVLEFEQARTITWRPGFVENPSTGELGFGGWTWRYDLTPSGTHGCAVVQTYDWSAVGPGPREYLEFPPFPSDHLANSLKHLSDRATGLRGVTESHLEVREPHPSAVGFVAWVAMNLLLMWVGPFARRAC